jgi:hypothetical protein
MQAIPTLLVPKTVFECLGLSFLHKFEGFRGLERTGSIDLLYALVY